MSVYVWLVEMSLQRNGVQCVCVCVIQSSLRLELLKVQLKVSDCSSHTRITNKNQSQFWVL